MLFSQDRRQLREVFFRAWQRHREHQSLEGVESLIVAVALRHPEYHALLEHPEQAEDRDYPPDAGQTAVQGRTNAARGGTLAAANPFLHMGMHIAIEEQLALDQPRGIRDRYQQLRIQVGDEHTAQHHIMECLGEWLWRAGREDTAPAESEYLDCLTRRAGRHHIG